ncbi:MAG: glycoside hydrolase family 2 protein [Actinomycetota bacterium]|nr:glycoside hydrolase family 2 protein [Actinomycetota bacterium]
MVRTSSSLNRDWRYSPRPLAEARVAGGAQRVTLPHSNVRVPAQGFDDRDYQFVSSYRRRLRLPPRAGDGRVHVRFEGVMSTATVFCNGERVGEHRGGFLPFTCDLTDHLNYDGSDELAVEVDSTERPDVPPFGGPIDYLTFGGIYRGVELVLLPSTFIADVFARPLAVLTPQRRIQVRFRLEGQPEGPDDAAGLELKVSVLDGDRVVAQAATPAPTAWTAGAAVGELGVDGLTDLQLWDTDHPFLYRVVVQLRRGAEVLDRVDVRTGLREARFEADGFFLNGDRVTLRGLNRHQTFPYVGAAMPQRVQRRDAEILRRELKCNAVRTSHYPQAPSFLDACDELGLLVFEEMPGWQHIGDEAWQDLACRDVAEMVIRDRNHPSMVLWGVRVNESDDRESFYRRTNEIAHRLDDSRQTSGVRYRPDSQLLEDVFALNDFQTSGSIVAPNHPRYLVSEYAGHMFPTKRFDNVERTQDHALVHATALNAIYAQPGIAGGFGWCAFDYATHAEFGSGNRICYHGVCDMFRVRKAAASVYRAQCDPAEEVVLEPAFLWTGGDHSDYGGPGRGLILSNCSRILAYVDDELVDDLEPDRLGYPGLPHAPFFFAAQSGIAPWRRHWGDLRLEGYLGDRLAAVRTLSGRGTDEAFLVEADDADLCADGADATRLVLRVTDAYGNGRPFATGVIAVAVDGPLEVVGENPVPLTGGVAVVWLRATEEPGPARIVATHPTLGPGSVRITVHQAEAEAW